MNSGLVGESLCLSETTIHPTVLCKRTFSLFILRHLLRPTNNDTDGFPSELVESPVRLIQMLRSTLCIGIKTPRGTDLVLEFDIMGVKPGLVTLLSSTSEC